MIDRLVNNELTSIGLHFSDPYDASDTIHFKASLNVINCISYIPGIGLGVEIYRILHSLNACAHPESDKKIFGAQIIRGIVGICLKVNGLGLVMIITDLAITAIRFVLYAKNHRVSKNMFPLLRMMSSNAAVGA